MNFKEVQSLVQKGEGLRIEFKKKAAFPEKIVREVIALANTEGGFLIIGVDDDGTISGQRHIEEEIFVMKRAISEMIFPPVSYELNTVFINPKKGLAIFTFPKSDHRPHYLKEDGKRKTYFRVNDRSIQASRELVEILRRGKKPRDVVFTYGEKENLLMKHLENHEKITVREFQRLANLPRFLASKTLVRLVLANVIEIQPQEKEDFFSIKPLQEESTQNGY